jgi:hypothetical protein
MGLPRATYYDAPSVKADDGEIVAAMTMICDEFEAYGYRRVGAELRHSDEVFDRYRKPVHEAIRRLRDVMVALHGGPLEGSVHPFNLAVRPRMIWFRQPVLGAVASQSMSNITLQRIVGSETVLRQIGELDAVVGEHGVDLIRG